MIVTPFLRVIRGMILIVVFVIHSLHQPFKSGRIICEDLVRTQRYSNVGVISFLSPEIIICGFLNCLRGAYACRGLSRKWKAWRNKNSYSRLHWTSLQRRALNKKAERVGFEPTEATRTSTVFETVPFNRSGISPKTCVDYTRVIPHAPGIIGFDFPACPGFGRANPPSLPEE